MKGASDIILYLKEDISLVESYALVMFGCLLKQIRLHMNLYTTHSQMLGKVEYGLPAKI